MNRYELEIKEKEINEQIGKILADDRGLAWDHRGSRDSCLYDAYNLIASWSRNPREPQTKIERLCQSIVETRQAFTASLDDRKVTWVAIREARDAEVTPEPTPFTVLTFRDETTGKRVRLTVATDTVEFL